MYIPDSIKSYISNKPYTFDSKGKSGAVIMMFHDAVLKIEEVSEEVRREERVISWLNGRLYVPSTIISVEEEGKIYRLMERIRGKGSIFSLFSREPSSSLRFMC